MNDAEEKAALLEGAWALNYCQMADCYEAVS